ncbi:MAG: hypothetical protein S4CHLAM7_15610 [Chlamydiae bacterium]|nr:hypothetical protein [Chlamydiota bacterium]
MTEKNEMQKERITELKMDSRTSFMEITWDL